MTDTRSPTAVRLQPPGSPTASGVPPLTKAMSDSLKRSLASDALLKRSALRSSPPASPPTGSVPNSPPPTPAASASSSSPSSPAAPSSPVGVVVALPPPPGGSPYSSPSLPLAAPAPIQLPPPPGIKVSGNGERGGGGSAPASLQGGPVLPGAGHPLLHDKQRRGSEPLIPTQPPELQPPPSLRSGAKPPPPFLGQIAAAASSRSTSALPSPLSNKPRPHSVHNGTPLVLPSSPLALGVAVLPDPATSTWRHKMSLGALIPRLGDIPTDPSLQDKVKNPKVKTDKCFSGEGLVNWMLQEKLASSKMEAIDVGELLLKGCMIQNLTGSEIKFGAGSNDIYCLAGAEVTSKKDQKKQEKKERKAKMEEEKRLKQAKKNEKGQKKKDKKNVEKPILVFGSTIEEVMALQRQPRAPEAPALPPEAATLDIPIVLKVLTEKIWELQGFKAEGAFRISGSQEEVDALKKQLNEQNYNVTSDDVHVVIGCLKAWIRELPEPLFPTNVYSQCVTFGSNDPKEAQKILDELPDLNKRIVYYVLDFVCKFLRPEYMAVTKMGVENISMIFAPLFLRSSQTMDPTMMLLNSGYESSYVQNIIENHLQRAKAT